MTRWLTRRHPRYIRSLVYMLQASEYDIPHFFGWHERAIDFRSIENRKRLVFTPKTLILLALGWGSVFFGLIGAYYAFVALSAPWGLVVALVLLLELPLVVLLSLVIATFILEMAQEPIIFLRNIQTRSILGRHRGIKIAIAGSYGKTSMREILRTVISAGKVVAAPPGSYNTPLAIAKFVRALKGDEDVIILELGEYYRGDVWKLCKVVRPDIGIITGVNEAHLEKFKQLEKTRDTVFELADWMREKPLYVNSENAISKASAPQHATLYGRTGAGEWKIEYPHSDLTGTRFRLSRKELHLDISSNLLGLHMLGSLAVAADIAQTVGLTPEQIRRGLGNTKPFEHRLELRSDEGGIVFLDDSYNGNPDGVRAVIEFLSSLKGHRRIYVTPGLVEMGANKEIVHIGIGKELAKAGIERIVLIRNSVTPFIEKGLKEAGYIGEVEWFDDGPSAYAALPHLTVKGDVVLLQNDWPDQYA